MYAKPRTNLSPMPQGSMLNICLAKDSMKKQQSISVKPKEPSRRSSSNSCRKIPITPETVSRYISKLDSISCHLPIRVKDACWYRD